MIRRQLCNYCLRKVRRVPTRYSSSYTELSQRKIVKVCGPQSTHLLQGLFTNDMNNVKIGSAIFAHLLNVKGRVLFDHIIYSVDENSYLIEVDATLVGKFVKLLAMYNIRSKADICLVGDKVYASFTPKTAMDKSESKSGGFTDPRLSLLGYRHIDQPPDHSILVSEDDYHEHRVSLGVSEGARDITHAKDFPFEHNLDLLQGVSFSKGCYIGQELTARTHHVGETRKRVVPVELSQSVPQHLLPVKLLSGKRSAGKLLSVYGNVGLAVIRFPYLGKELQIGSSGEVAVGTRPAWWPEDVR